MNSSGGKKGEDGQDLSIGGIAVPLFTERLFRGNPGPFSLLSFSRSTMHTMLQNEPVLTPTRISLPPGELQAWNTQMVPVPFSARVGQAGDPLRKNPIRVAFLTPSLSEGDVEMVIWNLMKRMNSIRFTSQLFCLHELGALGQDIAHSFPVTAHVVRRRHDFAAVGRFAKHLRGRVDALIVVGAGAPLFWSRISARLAKVPVVVNALPFCNSVKSIGRWNRLLTPWTDAYIAGSEAQRKLLVGPNGLPKQKVHLVPNGVDTQQFMFDAQSPFLIREQLGIPAGTPLCGLMSSAGAPAKSAISSDLMRQITNQVPAVHFLVIGAGPLASDLRHKCEGLSGSDRIHVVDDGLPRAQVLAALNVCCDLTQGDTLSDRMLEALAVQVPVVALLGTGNAAAIHADQTGLLVPAGDVEQLAGAVTRLVHDAALARRLGGEGRQSVVKHWSLERMVRGYEQVICDLYQRKRTGPGGGLAADDRHSVEFCGASP